MSTKNQLTYSEENYLKTVWQLTEREGNGSSVKTGELARELSHSPASATGMLHRLAERGMVKFEPYQGASLTILGLKEALLIVRRHRLWEVFLVDKLGFSWDEVHEIAEELEHVQEPRLIARLDEFLSYPTIDPHGDPIPDSEGKLDISNFLTLSEGRVGAAYEIVGVREQSRTFFEYLEANRLQIGSKLAVVARLSFDGSIQIKVTSEAGSVVTQPTLTPFAADHIIVKEV